MNSRIIIADDTDLDKFWLTQDGLSITNGIYFSLGSSYFCGHGCAVCYINDDLQKLKGKTGHIYGKDLKKMEHAWNDVFTFFSSAALDEDPFYLKLNHPNDYQWFVDNAPRFKYATTDNGVFRMARLKNVKFEEMFEIAISFTFIKKVGEQKLIKALSEIDYPIGRFKFLVNVRDFYPRDLIEWIKERKHPIVVHATDFTTGEVIPFEIENYEATPAAVNWVIGNIGTELMKIHVGSDCLLYYDRFYFTNKTDGESYFQLGTGDFDYRLFLSKILEGKQKLYLRYLEYVKEENYRRYYENTQNYKVNHDYTFIPNFMVNYKVRYFNRMKELGWVPTKYGLLAPNTDKIIPIIEKKK